MPEELQRLTDQHMIIARELLGGKTNEEAGFVVGMSAGYVSKLKSMEMFQLYMAKMRNDLEVFWVEAEGGKSRLDYVRNRARRLTPEAMDALEGLMRQDGDLTNRRQSAMALLDLTGDLSSLKEDSKTHAPAISVNIELHESLEKEYQESLVAVESTEVKSLDA